MPTPKRLVAGALALCLATPLAAQQSRCALLTTSPAQTTFRSSAADLPVDRLADLLVLAPGTSALNHGELSVRGAGRGANGLYLDGVPANPGWRNFASPALGGSYYGDAGAGIGIGTNGFEELRLITGLVPVDRGNAVGGVIDVETDPCSSTDSSGAPSLRASVASDAFLGADHGIGFNRLALRGGGRFGRLRVGGEAIAEGQRTARLGLDQNGSPIYLADGIDTTVTYNDGTVDHSVDILRFVPAPGIRLPSSAATTYTLGGHATYDLSDRHRLQLSAFASQRQARALSYEDLYNPRQAFADRAWSQVVTGSWLGRLGGRDRLALSGEAHLSMQWDHETNGPLSDAGERDSRDPASGLMLAPLGFRFDAANFPVNDALVDNFRRNSGRRSPYDLNDPTQYGLVDEFRNNAYGLLGFSESGGPTGLLTLYRERRLVGSAALTAQVGDQHRLRAGVEGIHYDLNLYSSQLTSQVLADAYVESPRQVALFSDYQFTAADIVLTAGFRVDHFQSGASRPDFPRISSMPGFDPANPTALFHDDRGHSRISPRVAAEFRASPKARLFAGISSLAQIPDFAQLYRGINTDYSITSQRQQFGTDLGFEHATLIEAGGSYLLDPMTSVRGSVWTRKDNDVIAAVSQLEFDPLIGSTVDVQRLKNAISGKATGIDLQLTRTLGSHGQAWVSYGYVSADSLVRSGARTHNLAAALLYETGPASQALGGVLRNVGMFATVRVASGTAYTRCGGELNEESGVLSDNVRCDIYVGTFNSAHLPATRVVDLRVTRTVTAGPTSLVIFADARNLLNTRNLIRVFTQTGSTTNELDRLRAVSGGLDAFANEASQNGARFADGTIDLTFGGAADPRGACGGWGTAAGTPAPPNCLYLLGAESRFGNGDHLFTEAEQTRAIEAYYYVGHGEQAFTGPGRRVRLGLEVRF